MKVKVEEKTQYKEMKDMAIGEVGVIQGSDLWYGGAVLRTFTGWVPLNNPNHTWITAPHWQVRLLPKGTIITLEVE